MGHFAFVNDENKVVDVITGRNENEVVDGISDWESYYSQKRPGLRAIRTSYNTLGGIHYNGETGEPSADQSKALRKNYAGVGFTYDEQRDAFIPPKSFGSWLLNEDSCTWEPPTPAPGADGEHVWNEETVSWDPVDSV